MNESIFSGYVSSFMVANKSNPIEVSGNLRLNQHVQLGVPFYHFTYNPLIPDYRHQLLDLLANDNIHLTATVTINKELLDDEELFNALRHKIEKENLVLQIRIADEGYTLTREDYNKLSFIGTIAVDNCVPELENERGLFIQNGLFKRDLQSSAQPVLERRTNFDDLEVREAFHINHPLSEDEFAYLAQLLDFSSNTTIELDYYNPNYYEEFLRGLQRHNVRNNINIQIIGYLLRDQMSAFNNLQTYPYEIDVVYSTCHDMIERYQEEPYTENRLYYSQIEGGGKTSLQNYLNVLNVVETFETFINERNLSPLEAAVFAKMQIDGEYIYDPDADNADEWDNINLSQMINHSVNGQKRAVCMGFSTLFSALLRRAGIPMFRYSTTGHSRNIGRISDEKYGIDTICTCDLTGDLLSSNSGLPTYSFFMVAPREYLKYRDNENHPEHMTIASAMSLPIDQYYMSMPNSNLRYEQFYIPIGYEPMGYAARMLELMDLAQNDGIGLDVYDLIYKLCENGQMESIPQDTVMAAIDNVIHILELHQDTASWYHQSAEESFNYRQSIFSSSPEVRGINDGETYLVEPLTQDNIGRYRTQLPEERPRYYRVLPDEPVVNPHDDYEEVNEIQEMLDEDDYIPGTRIPKPRERGIYESDDEYVNYLRQYYIDNFPNYRYLEALLKYINENNTTIYDYYVEIANSYRNHEESNIPQFERENPFIKDVDLQLLVESEDVRMPLYFARSLSKLVEENLPQYIKNQANNILVDSVEKYSEEVGKMF